MTRLEQLQKAADLHGIGMSKEKVVTNIYFALKAIGVKDVYIINSRYIGFDNGEAYQFIKSKKQCRWIVKQF